MALLLYNISIRLYGLGIRVASPFNPKARLFIDGRRKLFEGLSSALKDNQRPVAWFHTASLGEFEQGKPVIEAFRALYPDHFILVTFFSPSGYEPRKNYEEADHVSYLPLDTPDNARKFIDIVQPDFVGFVKYEFWYHYLKQAHKSGAQLYSISARFTPDQVYFKGHGGLYRKILSWFNHIFVQNTESLDLMKQIGIEATSISGDTRFDRVTATLAKPTPYPLVERFQADSKVMVIGSSWASDMEYLYPIVNRKDIDLKFIIAPHLVDEAHVKALEKGLQVPSVRITEADEQNVKDAKVLIINTIGMLSSIYQYGHLAYIGGAFGSGLHNILEAVTFGLPVLFGNKGLHKFPEATDLMDQGGAFAFNTQEALNEHLDYLNDPKHRELASQACKAFIAAQVGATQKIMNVIEAEYGG